VGVDFIRHALRGARIGVMRFLKGYSPETQAVFEQNLQALRDAGAVLIDLPEGPDGRTLGEAEFKVLLYELKHDLNVYLASTDPTQVRTRTLAQVIAFNAAEPRETVLFGQDIFEQAQAMGGLDDPDYIQARATSLRLAGEEGIDRLMRAHSLSALVAGGLTAIAVSIASVGLPGQVSFFAAVGPICLAMGLPLGVLPLLLAVEVIPDIFRTVGNVTADLAATRIVAGEDGAGEDAAPETDPAS
jgi:hypothetical protein